MSNFVKVRIFVTIFEGKNVDQRRVGARTKFTRGRKICHWAQKCCQWAHKFLAIRGTQFNTLITVHTDPSFVAEVRVEQYSSQ